MHIAKRAMEHAERLRHYDGSPSIFVPETPGGAALLSERSCQAVEDSPDMIPISPDSAYVSRPMEPDAAQWTVLPPSEYQTPSRGASSSTFAPSPTTERADKSEQLTMKDRRASPSPRASHREQQESREWVRRQEGRRTRRNAQSTQSLERSRARFKSSGTSKGTRVQLRWNNLGDVLTDEKSSSTDD